MPTSNVGGGTGGSAVWRVRVAGEVGSRGESSTSGDPRVCWPNLGLLRTNLETAGVRQQF